MAPLDPGASQLSSALALRLCGLSLWRSPGHSSQSARSRRSRRSRAPCRSPGPRCCGRHRGGSFLWPGHTARSYGPNSRSPRVQHPCGRGPRCWGPSSGLPYLQRRQRRHPSAWKAPARPCQRRWCHHTCRSHPCRRRAGCGWARCQNSSCGRPQDAPRHCCRRCCPCHFVYHRGTLHPGLPPGCQRWSWGQHHPAHWCQGWSLSRRRSRHQKRQLGPNRSPRRNLGPPCSRCHWRSA